MRVHGYGKRLCVCALVYTILHIYVRLVRDVANAKTTINHDAISCLDARHVRRARRASHSLVFGLNVGRRSSPKLLANRLTSAHCG